MFWKKFKNMVCASLLTLFFFPLTALAYSDYIMAGGENIGIQINTKGIMIVGLYKVDNRYPGREAGLKLGDKVLAINGTNVSSINEMVEQINADTDKTKIDVKYQRGNKTYSTTLNLVKSSDGVYRTGLYVKDTINGIGTLTYIDPKTKLYGALGHEIVERATGEAIDVRDGKILKSEVLSIEKSTNGTPGEKNARVYYDTIYGNIFENTSAGIFGNYLNTLPNKKLYKVAQPSDVKLGKATILTVLKNDKVEQFDINIIKLNSNPNQRAKNILFNITDTKLISETGGVVQGMSGSPIIQDEMIVGAVTHVVVEDSTKGYGIFIKYMLEEAES